MGNFVISHELSALFDVCVCWERNLIELVPGGFKLWLVLERWKLSFRNLKDEKVDQFSLWKIYRFFYEDNNLSFGLYCD